MSKKQKQLEKIRQNISNVSFEDLDKVLKWFGFEQRQPKGGSSHYVYELKAEPHILLITIPYKRPFIGKHYVKQALQILDELDKNEIFVTI